MMVEQQWNSSGTAVQHSAVLQETNATEFAPTSPRRRLSRGKITVHAQLLLPSQIILHPTIANNIIVTKHTIYAQYLCDLHIFCTQLFLRRCREQIHHLRTSIVRKPLILHPTSMCTIVVIKTIDDAHLLQDVHIFCTQVPTPLPLPCGCAAVRLCGTP